MVRIDQHFRGDHSERATLIEKWCEFHGEPRRDVTDDLATREHRDRVRVELVVGFTDQRGFTGTACEPSRRA